MGIKMVSQEVVSLACKGLCREYVDKYGVDTLVPERKLPFTDDIMRGLFLTPDGATRGNLKVDWSSYYWTAVDACFETLSEEGSRKDEVAKEKEDTEKTTRIAKEEAGPAQDMSSAVETIRRTLQQRRRNNSVQQVAARVQQMRTEPERLKVLVRELQTMETKFQEASEKIASMAKGGQ